MGLFDETAPVVERTPEGIKFRVNGVTPETQPLEVEAAEGQFQRTIGKDILAFSHTGRTPFVVGPDRLTLHSGRVHPLVEAVHLAFSRHYPLILTPDIIWLTIAQGFAQHVNNNAEVLRDRFVDDSGKKRLIVATDELSELAHWRASVEGWAELIASQVKDNVASLLVCNFSTSTVDTRMASQIVMMEAFQKYFDYELWCICGIPHVILRGTPDDWHEIQARVEQLQKYDLTWWTPRLATICEGLVRTAEGNPPLLFWQSMYKPAEAYGGNIITGWIADLFPYLMTQPTGRAEMRNPILETPVERRRAGNGLRMDDFPAGLSRVPFRLKMDNPNRTLNCELIAGCIGIRQYADTLALEPEIGWGIIESGQHGEALTSITEDTRHQLRPRRVEGWEDIMHGLAGNSLSAELVQLYDTTDGGTLYANSTVPIALRPLSTVEHLFINTEVQHTLDSHTCYVDQSGNKIDRSIHVNTVIGFGDLTDGRVLGCIHAYIYTTTNHVRNAEESPGHYTTVAIVRVQESVDQESRPVVSELKIVARSLDDFLRRLRDANGRLYFDDPDFIPLKLAEDTE
jgi:hypothetical protein